MNAPVPPAIFCSFSSVNAGAGLATVTITVFEVCVIGGPSPRGGEPVLLAEFECEPAARSPALRTWLHVYVVEAPGDTGLAPGPPASVPSSQLLSTRPSKLSGTLPLFLSTISYSTVSPTSPSSVDSVNAPGPMRWSFSIEKPGVGPQVSRPRMSNEPFSPLPFHFAQASTL